ncbi:MAG: molybdenum ABC transporter ATP-binding protein, partial [Pseudomonadota bacterium]
MSADGLILDVQVEQADFRLHIRETVSPVGITAIFGPSGAGKTTLLRAIAGFEAPTSGHIELNGKTFFDAAQRIDLPPHKRPIGFLFQDARLFSHMTVEQNIAYAEARVRSEHNTYSREDIIATCDISSLMERRPDTLSGGERQRVALARTLMSRPEILLLDEPLAALDRQRKLELVPLLADLPTSLGIPTLYVSHDIDEVSRVADHVIMLDAGQVLSSGPIDETLAIHGLEAGRNPY